MGLISQIVPVEEISASQFGTILRIMQAYYLNVEADQFRADLQKKDRVILLYEAGMIRGFSTWKLDQYEIDNRQVNIIFSGDTIIEKDCWRSMALPISWGRLMISVLTQHPGRKLFWLLTSKGYKTYRFLPVFFHEFYPCYRQDTPEFEKSLLNSYAADRFGNRFDPATGILKAGDGAQRLAPGVAEITESRHKDLHINFFAKMNPGHTKGDELVCLAPCSLDNIKPFILRYLKP